MEPLHVGDTITTEGGVLTIMSINHDGSICLELPDGTEAHTSLADVSRQILAFASMSETEPQHGGVGGELSSLPRAVLSEEAESHPEATLELETLDATLEALESELERLSEHADAAADGKAGAAVWQLRQQYRERIKDLEESAYFGRLVFREDGADSDTDVYLSHHSLVGGPAQVLDWRAPAGALFYSGVARQLEYGTETGRRVTISLGLKRRLTISGNSLDSIADDVDYRGSDPSQLKALRERARRSSRRNLAGDLAKSRDMQLKDIITTIQAEQDALIRAPSESIVAVSGVAGSGKTSIAYHRLSYLAYHGTEPAKMLFLGPNNLFLSYAQSIVPELGLSAMKHSTYVDWALGQVYLADGRLFTREARRQRDAHTYAVDESVSTRLDRARGNEAEFADLAAYFGVRGELRMAELLTRWARMLAPTGSPNVDFDWVHEDYPSLTIQIPATRAADTAVNVLRAYPTALGQARVDLIGSLTQYARSQMSQRMAAIPNSELREPREAVRSAAARESELAIERWVDDWWQRPSARRDYYRLIGDLDVLIELSAGVLTDDEILALHRPDPPTARGVRVEDVPAILALHVVLNGAGTDYAHIVVDEGQDFSPIQYWSLAKHCTKRSMTILGDLSQGVYSYRGISSWDSARTALGRKGWKFFNIRRSYRSTGQITGVCNAILRSLPDSDSRTAIPFPRRGPRPTMIRAQSRTDLYAAIARAAADALDRDYQTVAVISPDMLSARRMQRRLVAHGLEAVHLDGSSRAIRGCCVMAADNAKGLEFDLAIVADVDDEHYRFGNLHQGRELYVASTRAVHELIFVCSGTPSPYLTDALSLCELRAAEHVGDEPDTDD